MLCRHGTSLAVLLAPLPSCSQAIIRADVEKDSAFVCHLAAGEQFQILERAYSSDGAWRVMACCVVIQLGRYSLPPPSYNSDGAWLVMLCNRPIRSFW